VGEVSHALCAVKPAAVSAASPVVSIASIRGA
jgi:hypothetical protein